MPNPTKKRISISQIGTYTTCNYKWYLTYERGVRVRRGDVSPASLGDVTHFGLAAGLRALWQAKDAGEDWTVENYYSVMERAINLDINNWDIKNRPALRQVPIVIGEDQTIFTGDVMFYDHWESMLDTARTLAIRTLRHIRIVEDYTILTIEGQPAVEMWIDAEIPDTEFGFGGIVDLVAYNKVTGANEVIDWKVRAKMSHLQPEQLSMQIGLYQHVLREKYGVDAPFGIVYQIRSEAPKEPSLNKPDKYGIRAMSRAKIPTDWPMYRQALLRNGLNPADYIEEMQPKLADVEFWRPLPVVRLPEVTQRLWDNMVMHSRKINSQTEFPRAYGYACQRCPFADLCNAELYDHDTEALFENKYYLTEWAAEAEDIEEKEEL